MPAQPAVHGLQVGDLLKLREAVEREVVVGVRQGADLATLRGFADVLGEIDRRLERRSVDAERAAENRLRVAATRSPTHHGMGAGPSLWWRG